MLASSVYNSTGSTTEKKKKTTRRQTSSESSASSSATSASGLSDSGTQYGYAELRRMYFNDPSVITQSRKELESPLLKYTPANELWFLKRIWKVMQAFLDAQDSKKQQNEINEVNKEPIMSMLKRTILTDSNSYSVLMKADDKKKISTKNKTHTWSKFGTVTSSIAAKLKNKTSDSETGEELCNLNSSLLKLQYIIGYAILKPAIRDEVYCMSLQYLNQPISKSCSSRGWLMFTCIASCIKPSDKIFPHIIKFLENSKSTQSASIIKSLNRTAQHGGRYQTISNYEYLSMQGGRTLEISITLMDGSSYNVPVDSATTSEEFVTSLSRLCNLEDKFGFSVFVSMGNKVTSLGCDKNNILDSISSCEQIYFCQHGKYPDNLPTRFFMRKEIFSPWQGIDHTTSDSVAMRLIYSQIVRGITIKEYICENDDKLSLLVALQYLVEYGTDLTKAGLRSFLPSCLPKDKLQLNPIEYWMDKVISAYSRFHHSNPKLIKPNDIDISSKMMTEVVKLARQDWLESFSKRFRVLVKDENSTESEPATLKLNSNGIWILNNEGRTVRSAIEFHVISEASCYNRQLRSNLHTSSHFEDLEKNYNSAPNPSNEDGNDISKNLHKNSDLDLQGLKLVDEEDFVLAVSDTVELKFWDGKIMKIETVEAWSIYQMISFIHKGLKNRSVWAIAKSQCVGDIDKNFIDSEPGDLLRLSRSSQQEAMIALSCVVENISSGKIGKVSVDSIELLPVSSQPSCEFLAIVTNGMLRL